MEKTWKVQVQDNISTPGIIEVVAMEDYDCKSDEPLIKVVDPNPEQEPEEYQIIGNTFIKPLTKQNYTVIGPPNLKWSITLPASNNKEIKDVLKYNVLEDGSIDVTWTAMIPFVISQQRMVISGFESEYRRCSRSCLTKASTSASKWSPL